VTRGHEVKDDLDCNHAPDRCHLKSITITVTIGGFISCMRDILCQSRTKNEIPLKKKSAICDSEGLQFSALSNN